MQAVSVIRVRRREMWPTLIAAVGDDGLGEELSHLERVVLPAFERKLSTLAASGIRVLVRYARRSAEEQQASAEQATLATTGLAYHTRQVLFRAQRIAREGIVLGAHAWDPEHDAPHVRALLGAGLLLAHDGDPADYAGRYRLHGALAPPPVLHWDFEEALMEETDDLGQPQRSPMALLHDLAALSAACIHVCPERTAKGSLSKRSVRQLGMRLGQCESTATDLTDRWQRALRALELLGVLITDPLTRVMNIDPSIEHLLLGSSVRAVDGLLDRLVDRDLRPALPAVRSALSIAEGGAIDEVIFRELISEQHRDLWFTPWTREGALVYPELSGNRLPWTPEAFEVVEGRMLEEALVVLEKLGLIRRAPGVFAPTDDGLLWATGTEPAAPPVWLGSDLEILVPPHSITPWERFQLERIGRCIQRDIVDRYALERQGLESWLADHELSEALEMFQRRCLAVPRSVTETLDAWHEAATEVVLTRGVLIP